MATPKQIARIKILQKERAMDDEDYREFLLSRFGVRSAKDLSQKQAFVAIEAMGGEKQSHYKKRFENDPGNRDNFASPAQLRKIEAMWAEVSYTEDEQKRREALDKFLYRRFKCWMRSMPQSKVGPVIKTLTTMRETQEGPDGAA
jgi:phage gp16-like protein